MVSDSLPLPVTAVQEPRSQPCNFGSGGNPEKFPCPNISLDKHGLGYDVEKSISRMPEHDWPIPDPISPARVLNRKELILQRTVFINFVLAVNITLACLAVFNHVDGIATLVVILLFKVQDFLCSAISLLCLLWQKISGTFHKPEPASGRWILSLLPAYSESEEQILKAIESLRENNYAPHKQILVTVIDGNPKDIRGGFCRVVADFKHPYRSLKDKAGTVRVTAGFFKDLPVILIEKFKNSGKKDSLVLSHDLFNYPRDNMPIYTRLLRDEIWTNILPVLTAGTDFRSFDMIFSTDADSVIHKGCMRKLADALCSDSNAIAACGLLFVEFEPGYSWSFWNLFQLLQYAYGQFIRRWAEGFVGKVTCLPGCATMIAVREEMAGAIAKFARPVTKAFVLHHQVQNLGTDRRLTYCMLSQSKRLRTLFVPDAMSETVAPQSFKHYLQQRRRWGSNAYFNNFFYFGGPKMILFTRLIAWLHIMRQTCVYYRVVNTVLFIRFLVTGDFHINKIIPLLVVAQFPTIWFMACMLAKPCLRARAHKIIAGFFINKLVSPIMSTIVFAVVITSLGNAVWGISGITSSPSTLVDQKKGKKSKPSSRPQSPSVSLQAEVV